MYPRVLVFFLLLALFLLPGFVSMGPVAAQEEETLLWGFWSGGVGDEFKPLYPATVLCVWAEGPVVLDVDAKQHPGYRFEPGDEPVCRMVLGGLSLRVEEASGEVRVVAMRAPPRVLERPGVTPLGEEGSAVLVRGLSPEGEVTLASGGPGWVAQAWSWPTLSPLVVDQAGGLWRLGPPRDDAVLVAALQEGPEQGLVRWSDPGWFPVAPNLGQVLAPVALALLVALFRGGAGGAWVRPGAARKKPGLHKAGPGRAEGPDGPAATSGR